MMESFSTLIIIGRPASGKSEIIDFLTCLDPTERQRKYHVARLDVLDDFPLLWAWFEEDHILNYVLSKPRLHTDDEGYFKHHYFWDLLVERLDLEYRKRLKNILGYCQDFTSIIEFSRGSEHGGYSRAFNHLSDEILSKAGVVYIDVPYEESLRKNRRRFNPEKPESILEHSLPDEKLERLYRYDDWESFSAGDASFLKVRSLKLPYVVFENADDVTTGKPQQLAIRLENVLGRLWELIN